MASAMRRARLEPVATEVSGTVGVDMGEAETILSKFIDNSMLSQRVSVVSQTVLGQLKRVQRDLRGLPPMLVNTETGESVADSQYVTESAAGVDEPQENGNKKISKEDRKKLKKQRRKQEKRDKAEKKASKAKDHVDEDSDADEMETD
jgi:hypothetical protein